MVKETGGIDALQIETAWPVPKIADGQVLVKNEFSGINFIDTYHRSGLYKRDLPFVGGQEGGGTIAAVTPKAEAMGFKVGQRVAYSILQTYCEYSAVPAAKLQPVPDNVGLDVATACVVQVSISPPTVCARKAPSCCPPRVLMLSCCAQGMTAHYLTDTCNAGLIKAGEWTLIHGVGGGTCQWAAQVLCS